MRSVPQAIRVLSAFVLLLAGCVSFGPDPEALALIEAGRYEEGLARLADGVRKHPQDIALRSTLARQREMVIYRLLTQAELAKGAGDWDRSESLYTRAVNIDPGNSRAAAGLAGIAPGKAQAERMKNAIAQF